MKVKAGFFLLDALAATAIIVIIVSIIATASGIIYLQHSANMKTIEYNAVIESKLSVLSGESNNWNILPESEVINNITFNYEITQTNYNTTQLHVLTLYNTTKNNFILEVTN